MRMIDADALREQLVWCKEQAGRYNDYWDDVIERVDSLPTVGGWVNVKDRLPEEHPSIFAPWYGGSRWTKAMWRKESDSVLLAYKTPDTGTYVIKEGRTHDGKFHSGNITLDNNCEVTHWMEMPKPPKGDKEDA